MNKKKILKKQEFSLKDMKIIKLHDESKFSRANPEDSFKDKDKVAKVLLECLIENDTETFMEVLDAYLDVNRTEIAKRLGTSRIGLERLLDPKNYSITLLTIAQVAQALGKNLDINFH